MGNIFSFHKGQVIPWSAMTDYVPLMINNVWFLETHHSAHFVCPLFHTPDSDHQPVRKELQ